MNRIWLAPSLAMLVATGVSLVGVAVLLRQGLERLNAMRAAHWTERARELSETHAKVIWFRRCVVMGTALLVLPKTPLDGAPRAALRFFAAMSTAGALASYPLLFRWLERATAGELTPLALWRNLANGAVISPSFWILVGFGVNAPNRYDRAGELWVVGLVLTLIAAQAGGAMLVGRALGWIRPVEDDVRQAIAAAAQASDMREPRVFEMYGSYVRAVAVPFAGWVVVTRATLTRLAPRYVPALVIEAARRARSPLQATLTWIAPAAAAACLIGFVPLFPESPAVGLLFGGGVWVAVDRVLGWIRSAAPHLGAKRGVRAPSEFQKLRRRAEWRAYARCLVALSRQYQANWTPMTSDTPPSLYDLLKGVSLQLPYPRPRAARGFHLVVVASAVVCVLLIGGPGLNLLERLLGVR